MPYLMSYVVGLVVFLSIDIVWIRAVMKPLFERNLGEMLLETPRLGAAGAFYACYVAGVVYFAVVPATAAESWRVAALNGAIIGFLAYGTYEATNFATLRGWTYQMLLIDISWGVVLTCGTAVAGYAVLRWAST